MQQSILKALLAIGPLFSCSADEYVAAGKRLFCRKDGDRLLRKGIHESQFGQRSRLDLDFASYEEVDLILHRFINKPGIGPVASRMSKSTIASAPG
jgi:hypothetical protein